MLSALSTGTSGLGTHQQFGLLFTPLTGSVKSADSSLSQITGKADFFQNQQRQNKKTHATKKTLTTPQTNKNMPLTPFFFQRNASIHNPGKS